MVIKSQKDVCHVEKFLRKLVDELGQGMNTTHPFEV
jgi:hypothetical protein